jgi:DNA-binding NtrC family response regulator
MKKNRARILIVDDEQYICKILSRLMEKQGFDALTAYEGETALKLIRSEIPDVLLLDLMMPGINGMKVMKYAKELDPDLPVVMITGHANIQGAVEAIQAGAHNYLAKPFQHFEVIEVVKLALAERDLKQKLKSLSDQLEGPLCLRKMMGPSKVIGSLVAQVKRVAKTDFTVVIQGETGSGKELVAQAIHQNSLRAGGPWVAIDCGAIPEGLLESELFGHQKGAFTGAFSMKIGKFEAAKDGTLLMDEISNLPVSSQGKILRTLQEKKICRLGSTKPLNVDIRLLVACNKDLKTVVESGVFREDLFYRLNEFTISVPPLRKRKKDIPYLAKRFLDITNIALHKSVKGFSESALRALLAYSWPGNVRQFRSIIRRAVLLADDLITDKHLEIHQDSSFNRLTTSLIQKMRWEEQSLKTIVKKRSEALEREIILSAIEYTGGNKAQAARLLQIDYKTIHTKIKKLAIS